MTLGIRPAAAPTLPPADPLLIEDVVAAWAAARPNAVLLGELLDSLARARGQDYEERQPTGAGL